MVFVNSKMGTLLLAEAINKAGAAMLLPPAMPSLTDTLRPVRFVKMCLLLVSMVTWLRSAGRPLWRVCAGEGSLWWSRLVCWHEALTWSMCSR